MKHFKTRLITLSEEEVIVDNELHKIINTLAGLLYEFKGYINNPDLDYYNSSHPMEKEMYAMALRAYIFNRDIGFDQ